MLEVGQAAVANSQAAAMIGSEVTARSDQIRVAEGGTPAVAFELDGPAASVTVTITDDAGRTVHTMTTGARGAGAQRLSWDGPPLAAGTYHVSVSAQDASGAAVAAHARIRGTVTAVSYENGYPELLIDDVRVRLGDVVAVGGTEPAGR